MVGRISGYVLIAAGMWRLHHWIDRTADSHTAPAALFLGPRTAKGLLQQQAWQYCQGLGCTQSELDRLWDDFVSHVGTSAAYGGESRYGAVWFALVLKHIRPVRDACCAEHAIAAMCMHSHISA